MVRGSGQPLARTRLIVVALLPLFVAILWAEKASAAPLLTADAYPVTIHGSAASGVQKITTEGGSVECTFSYHAETAASSTAVALSPTGSKCQAFGFLEATFTPNGCTYQLDNYEQTGEDKFASRFGIVCPAGKSITVLASTCEIEIPAQAGLTSVELVNDTAASPRRDITFKPEVGGLAYKVLKDGFLCPFGGTGSKTGGSFTASSATTLTGQSPSNPETKIGIDVG